MRTLVHISDIHFGRVDYSTLEPLAAGIREVAPDLLVVSGDLTQRARSEQFREARTFLDSLPYQRIVIPGNHDVPLHNPFARFLTGLAKYRRYISDDLEPFFVDEEIAVLGINTARSLTFKGGRINAEQVARIRERLCGISNKITKIIVTHHPFDLPEGYDEKDLVGRARMAMEALAECGADLFLAGHFHISYTGSTSARYTIDGYTALVIQAGTATSTRGRGEPNAFNVIRIERPSVVVDRYVWESEKSIFIRKLEEQFQHDGHGWRMVKGEG